MSRWQPIPGAIATYRGQTRAGRRMVRVIAEAVGDCMIVEAIGRKGICVRFTVKRHSLSQPQPDLFD
ncbi:MAG: hypothetical protein FWF20_03045 [Betaproteobacteria bacterium]|nr:hypothetical protein [Betaproteobacteria bacterium]MCL2885760.1 hypothetical protein [Betaproteobacteria bacterium]